MDKLVEMLSTTIVNAPTLLAPSGLKPVPLSYSPQQTASHAELSDLLKEDLSQDPQAQAFADAPCLYRYLRATKWNVSHARDRIRDTLAWRKDFKPIEIHPDEVKEEAASGKQFFNGFDKEGRPILHLVPGRENTKSSDHQLRFVVFNLEKAIQLMPEGVETMVIVIDYAGMSMFNAPSPGRGRKFLSILGNHYPERLGLGFVVHPTWYIWTFFTLLGPFLDPVTKAKIHMVSDPTPAASADAEKSETQKHEDKHNLKGCNDMTTYIPSEMLLKEYGGEHPFEWDFETYWDHLNATAKA